MSSFCIAEEEEEKNGAHSSDLFKPSIKWNLIIFPAHSLSLLAPLITYSFILRPSSPGAKVCD